VLCMGKIAGYAIVRKMLPGNETVPEGGKARETDFYQK